MYISESSKIVATLFQALNYAGKTVAFVHRLL